MVEKSLHLPGLGAAVLLLAAGSGCDRPDDPVSELRRSGIEEIPGAAREAVARGDAAMLAAAIRAGSDLDRPGSDAWPPLHRAVLDGRADLARRLIGSGSRLALAGPGNRTPVVLAIETGQPELVDLLLLRGAPPAAGTGASGEPPLVVALEHGGPALALRLLAHGADPKVRTRDGDPFLHRSIRGGHRELAGELLGKGADPLATGPDGDPPVLVALEHDWIEGARVLVGRMPEDRRREVLEQVLEQRRFRLAKELAALGVGTRRELLDAHLAELLAAGNRQASAVMLGLGARPESIADLRAVAARRPDILHLVLGYRGVSDRLLHRACREGWSESAGLMLAHGSGPNPAGLPFSETALTAAIERGDERLAIRLVRSGSWARTPGRRGQSALALAIAQGRHGLVREMLEHGADPNLPLRAPVDEAFVELVRGKNFAWLLGRDSRITPLMLAVDSGSIELAALLIEHGAEVDVRTRRESIWPINIAAWHDDIPMMRLLLGVDPFREERFARVDLSRQRLVVSDAAGEELFSSPISSGRRGYRTPTGEFVVTNRHRSWTSTIYNSSMPYFLRLNCGDVGFHAGYVPGYPASHGCMRLPHSRAAKLFRVLRIGDRVRIEP